MPEYQRNREKQINTQNLEEIMEYRIATTEDVEECFRLSRQENEEYWDIRDFSDLVSNPFGIFIVAKEDGVKGYITGFIVPTKKTEGMIHETRTDVRRRGEGIGSELIDVFCQVAKEKGVKIVYAMIEQEVKRFYLKSNFKISGNWIEISKEL
ncbi:MAG: GNAT family N-acetyltransferase [Candidatus Woesearchaeota archaeon]